MQDALARQQVDLTALEEEKEPRRSSSSKRKLVRIVDDSEEEEDYKPSDITPIKRGKKSKA